MRPPQVLMAAIGPVVRWAADPNRPLPMARKIALWACGAVLRASLKAGLWLR